MDLPTALPGKMTHVAMPMSPGTMPTYLGLKKVIKNKRMPAINSRYDGWRVMNDFILSIFEMLSNANAVRRTVRGDDALCQGYCSLRDSDSRSQGWRTHGQSERYTTNGTQVEAA
jgi:hypothetical protein